MKTNTAPRNVSVSATQSSTFSISNNAKIFRILIDGLYADKIQSITREIWSNALDAHVQAGCADRPFDVSFPNPFDPTFRVRDYGVSLTHDQVMHMYTDLGHSTKEDTNDAIGKFGIGSKSPFAYTDNFTVTVYLNGTVRFYSAMIGSDGVPAIHLLGEQDTDEENGVEVAFPVESADTNAFQNAAKRVSHGFDVKPNVVNSDSFSGWPELDVLLEGEGWKLLKGSIEGYQEKSYARMGPVLYPINPNALGNLTDMQRQMLGHTFVIDFAMGDLEITASREELSYGRNDPTAESIRTRIAEITDMLTQRCLDQFAACETYFDACVMYRDQTESSQIPHAVKNIVKKEARWNDRALTTALDLSFGYGASAMVMPRTKMTNSAYRFRGNYNVSLPANKKTLVMVEDITQGEIPRATTRVSTYVKSRFSEFYQILWIKVHDTNRNQIKMIDAFGDLDGIETVMVEDLPVPARMNYGRASAARRPVQVRRFTSNSCDERVDMSAQDFEAGGIYVPLDRMEPVVPTGMVSPTILIQRLRSCGALEHSDTIYGAPKSLWKKFAGDQWINLYDYAQEWFEAQEYDFPQEQATRRAVEAVLDHDVLTFLVDHCSFDGVAKDSPAHVARDLHSRASAIGIRAMNAERNLAAALGIEVDMGEGTRHELEDELELISEELSSVYPMLSLLVSANVRYCDNVIDKVTGYVIMCDTANATNQHQAAIAA